MLAGLAYEVADAMLEMRRNKPEVSLSQLRSGSEFSNGAKNRAGCVVMTASSSCSGK